MTGKQYRVCHHLCGAPAAHHSIQMSCTAYDLDQDESGLLRLLYIEKVVEIRLAQGTFVAKLSCSYREA